MSAASAAVMDRAGTWAADRIALLAAGAVAAGLLVPSKGLAGRSDWLLAGLVLFTAAGIDPRRLTALRRRVIVVASLSFGPFLALAAGAWLISRGFDGDVRNGALCLGLASTEVASVGLVGLAGGDSVLALGVLCGSLVVSAVLGPLLVGALAHTSGHVTSLGLLGRFALVVLVPLIIGLISRAARPRLSEHDGSLDGLAAVTVCVLLYAAISGVDGGRQLLQGVIAGLAFMAVSLAAGGLAARALRGGNAIDQTAVLLTTWLRDFAVAATLATQAFSPSAASVAGIYGALMLLAGASAATLIRRRDPPRSQT